MSYLYQKALYAVFPAHAESSTAAVTDALLSHTPVLLSDIEAMHEAAGAYAGYFLPEDAERLAELVCQGLNDPTGYRQQKQELRTYRPMDWNGFCRDLRTRFLRLIDS